MNRLHSPQHLVASELRDRPHGRRRLGCAIAVSAAGLLTPAAMGQQILELHGESLTSYLPAAASSGQGVSPLHLHRGVGIDGTMRSPSMQGWRLAGNPFGDAWDGRGRVAGVNLASGTADLADVDLVLPSAGPGWVVGRTYSVRQDASGHVDSDGYQGRNWFQTSQPELKFYDTTPNDKDVIYILYGADRYLEFVRTGTTSTEFKGKNGAAGVVQYASGSPDTWTYTDQFGNQTVFFGGNTSGGAADWQFWKMTDPAGNVIFAGDASTASTAVSNGYSGKKITTVYDQADRRYSYTYSTIDSVSRLTRVKAETKSSGTWSSPSGVATVGQVDYAYYQTGDNTYGDNGCLKSVTITTPLSTGSNHTRTKLYRYYKGAYNSSTNPGYPYAVKLVLGYEGYRAFDWAQDSALDDDPLSASTDDLKSYAEAYFEYEDDGAISFKRRINKAWFNGECGCSGGANGTYEFTYGAASSYSTYIGNTSYDTTGSPAVAVWATRTVVKQPDSTWVTQYFDETGQPLSRVVTTSDPSGSPSGTWPTYVKRDDAGGVVAIHTPDNISAYDHSGTPGTFTPSPSAGLITTFVRSTSGDMKNFVLDTKYQESTAGSSKYLRSLTYGSVTKTIGASGVVRPYVSATDNYKVANTIKLAGDYDTLTTSTTAHSSALPDKELTITAPTVSTSANGPNSATSMKRFERLDGTTAFSKDAVGVFTYTKYTNGQVVKLIRDAQTNHGSDFASGDDPNTDFGVSETGDGLRYITAYTYDAQGRLDSSTLPDGRVTKMYYTKLADGRLVTLSVPRFVAGSPDTFYGPVACTVSNLAGKPEAQITVALSSSTAALSGWIDDADSDPITAVDVGTVARLATSIYSGDGHKLTESRTYHVIPGSMPGSDGTNYDATLYGYDDMGRQRRVKQATGTIARTVYDARGHTSERWIGTNDSSFAGGESSGVDNMVKTEALEYDGGANGKNGYLTARTLFIQDNSTGQRQTTYANDFRGRMILQTNPQAPHVVNAYDNLGRVTATGLYSSASGLNATSAPTTTTNRVGYSETAYDEAGRVYQTVRHKIAQSGGSAGSSTDSIATDTWYDPAGRVMKVRGEQLVKTRYDRLGRATKRFTLATDDDSQYQHASASTAIWDTTNNQTSVAGDIVLEESQTAYDDAGKSGLALMQVSISRLHDDLSNGRSGELDTNADADAMVVTAANVKGRVQITSMWYDSLDRPETTAAYGTNAIVGDASTSTGTFTRTALSAPARSDTVLVTTNVYNTDGTLQSVTDPKALVTRYEYDAAGRKTKQINNYVDGTPSADTDQTVAYAFTDGLLTSLTADMPAGTNDQVTTYVYGVIKGGSAGDSKISSGNLLLKAIYPEQSGGQAEADKRVMYAYNAQGQVIWTKDQTGTILETDYDTAGRETQKRATTTAGGIDTAVLRIATTYNARGMRELVTSYDNATVGSGSVVNEVKFTRDDWGLLSNYEQDNNSAVGAGGSTDDYEVAYAYAKSAGSGKRQTIRRTEQKLKYASTDQQTVTYEYLSTGNLLDDAASRVTDVKVASTVVATYKYNGAGQLVGTTLDEPAYFSQAYAAGASTGVFANWDRFNRVVTSAWTKDLGTDRDLYHVDLSYDRNSNITDATDTVNKNGSGTRIFDVKYSMDSLNRLTKAEEGTFSGSISNRSRQQLWTLDQVGNQSRDKVDLNGDNDFVDSGEIDDTRVHNDPNELLTRDTDSNSSVNYTLTYNKRGDMTDDGQRYTYVLDAFGRLKTVKTRGGSPATVAEYTYDGLGHRIGWHYDTDIDSDVDASDRWYWFAHDDRWRIVATFRGTGASSTDASPKEQFVFHAGGLNGTGGSSYIDSVILREKDDNSGWTSAADGTLELRRYYLQNWRADVSAMVEADGTQIERVKYSAYGVPIDLTPGDFNADAAITSQDDTDFQAAQGGAYDVRTDLNMDGNSDFGDYLAFLNEYGTGEAGGRGVLSRPTNSNRTGYAGYQHGSELLGTKWHVRHRVLDSELGRWTRRDPLEYLDGMNLFLMAAGSPMIHLDASGTVSTSGPGILDPWAWPAPYSCHSENPEDQAACRQCCVSSGSVLGMDCYARFPRGPALDDCNRDVSNWTIACLTSCGFTEKKAGPIGSLSSTLKQCPNDFSRSTTLSASSKKQIGLFPIPPFFFPQYCSTIYPPSTDPLSECGKCCVTTANILRQGFCERLPSGTPEYADCQQRILEWAEACMHNCGVP